MYIGQISGFKIAESIDAKYTGNILFTVIYETNYCSN